MIGSPTKDLHLIYNAPMLGAQAFYPYGAQGAPRVNADARMMQ